MAVSILRYANREAVAQALTERGYSVSRATVNRWARGKEMPGVAAQMVAELFGHPDTTKEAPPWAEPLVRDVPLTKAGVDELLVQVAALQAVLESRTAPPPPPAGGQDDSLGTDGIDEQHGR